MMQINKCSDIRVVITKRANQEKVKAHPSFDIEKSIKIEFESVLGF